MKSPSLTVYCGDFLTESDKITPGSVHCCVTSPPYFSRRDYGIEPSDWPAIEFVPMTGCGAIALPAMSCCLGLETKVEAFVGHIVHVFRIVKKLLRDDGTCWMNMGDTFCGGGFGGPLGKSWSLESRKIESSRSQNKRMKLGSGFKDKDLLGVPWRCALALQADGWYLRMDNIWAKDNPMPESAPDRPTKAHEYVFLFAKSQNYFYDREAVREAQTGNAHSRGNGITPKSAPDKNHDQNGAATQRRPTDGVKANHSFHQSTAQYVDVPGGRNMRSVWRMKVQPFHGPHTATFPSELAQRCIMAGTSLGGCCAECGAPYLRIMEDMGPDMAWRKQSGGNLLGTYDGESTKNYQRHGGQDASSVKKRILESMNVKKTLGWKAQCECSDGGGYVAAEAQSGAGAPHSKAPSARTKPCLVLDPFLGSGTTAKVALELGRSFVGTEKNAADMEWIKVRTDVTGALPLI